jgi:hypothetical protein
VDVKLQQINQHKHDLESEIKLEVQKVERKTVAEDIILKHKGSAKRYLLAAINNNATCIPSLDALRKIKQEYIKTKHSCDVKILADEDDIELEPTNDASTDYHDKEEEEELEREKEEPRQPIKYTGSLEWLTALCASAESFQASVEGRGLLKSYST